MESRAAATEGLWDELRRALNDRNESAGIILAGLAEEADRLTLCLNRIIWVPADAYEVRSPRELKIRSEGWMPALAEASEGGWQPIFFHTHPGSGPLPSRYDEEVARELAPVFKARAGRPYASLILGGSGAQTGFTGTLSGKALVGMRVVGDRLRLLRAADAEGQPGEDVVDSFDRQMRAFGRDGQRLLGRLRVGLVGGGGTGSAVFEQLVRLGVGAIVLIDDDDITATNLTRIHGSTMADVGKPKVGVLTQSAYEIGLGTVVEPRQSKVTDRSAFEALRGCDLVFGCTDDNAGRAVLSRLAYHYNQLVIDLGVVISGRAGEVTGLDARASVMVSGAACLFCRGRIDPNRLREELLPEQERADLLDEGYARGLADPDPAVLTYTTMIACFGVDEMLQRLFGFGEAPSSEILVRPIQREVRRLGGSFVPGHFCCDPKVVGRADQEPPLGLGWA